MNTTFSTTGLAQTTASTRRVFNPFRRYWGAFQEWRKRERLRATLCGLDDRELQDIGIARGEADYVALNRSIDPRGARSTRAGTLFIVMLCTALFAREASAQCTPQDVLRNQLTLKKTPSANMPPILVRSASDVPVWKTITVGTFANSLALRNALDAAGCGIGNSAGEILARPAFTTSVIKTNVMLLAVSVAELGFETDTASLADIYARAQQLGFGLAAAEVAPQLRLQYFDQPIGEFLIIGMKPIKTWSGEPVILNVANGGAGLILISQDGGADAEIPVACRFLFVRSNEVASAKGLDEAAALVDR